MYFSSVLLIFFIGSTQVCRSVQENTAFQEEETRLMDKLLESYDSRVRPSGTNGTVDPVDVKLSVVLLGVTSISDYDMDFGVRISLKQEWLDERLKYEDNGKMPSLTFRDSTKLWTPDLFFANEKDGDLHRLMVPNTYLRIFPSGRVEYTTRISLTLWCSMQLERFPFDSQLCSIEMATFAYTEKDLTLAWTENNSVVIPRLENVDIMGFDFKRVQSLSWQYPHPTAKIDLVFKRGLKYYILHTFLPSTVLVVVSWASFWMDRRAVVARILIVLSTLFAMSSLSTDIEASVPHVPYVKALDLWMGMCFTFLLATLVEFAMVNATTESEVQLSSSTTAGKVEDRSTTVDLKPLVRKSTDSTQTEDKITSKTSPSSYHRMLSALITDPRHIDSVARLLFPLFFLVFATLYFISQCLLERSNSVE